MNNFIFENKTKVYFGKGGVKEYLGSLLVNYGETVMLAYGGADPAPPVFLRYRGPGKRPWYPLPSAV